MSVPTKKRRGFADEATKVWKEFVETLDTATANAVAIDRLTKLLEDAEISAASNCDKHEQAARAAERAKVEREIAAWLFGESDRWGSIALRTASLDVERGEYRPKST